MDFKVWFYFYLQANVINSFYLVITGIISLVIVIYSLSSTFQKAEFSNDCLKWKFMSNSIVYIPLGIMYTIMFFWIFTDKETIKPNIDKSFIFDSSLVLFLTYLFSEQMKFNCNMPSMWCLSSAISAPIFTLL